MSQLPTDAAWMPQLGEEEPSAGLQAIRARIAADLVMRQGRFRRSSVLVKALPIATALAAAVGFMLARAPSREWIDLPSALLALLAAVLAGGAAGIAPSRPGLSERLSLVAVLVAAAGLTLEAGRGVPGSFSAMWAAVCAGSIVVGAAVPTFALGMCVLRSGLAARPLHTIALAGAGMLAAGAAQWRHCPLDERWHLVTGHVVVPLVVCLGAAVVVARMTRPPPLPP